MTHIGRSEKVLFMRIFISVLILIFSFQSWTKADDLRDLEIEGISIGENALDYFSKEEIDANKTYYPNSKRIWKSLFILNDKEYDSLQLHLKSENNKYIIVGIAGLIYFYDEKDSFNQCIKKRSVIVNDLEQALKNTKKSDEEKDIYESDKSGKSYVLGIYFDFKDDFSEYVKVACTTFSDKFRKENNFPPSYLRVGLTSTEFHLWLKEEAFK